MSSKNVFLRTTIPGLALGADGNFVSLPLGKRRPTKAPKPVALQGYRLAAEQNLRFLANGKAVGDGSSDWLFEALGISADVVKVGSSVAALASGVGAVVGGIGAAKKIGEMLGIFDAEPTLSEISDQISAINARLEQIFAEISRGQALDYAAWAASHWRDVGNLVGKLKTSIAFAQFALAESEKPSDLAKQRLASADVLSQEALQTLMGGGLDGGYWMRPAFPAAIQLASWQAKTDARPPVVQDGRVWDWRIALPTLLLGLTARQIVLRTIEVTSRRKGLLRAEARTWTRFVGALGGRVNQGIAIKRAYTPAELAASTVGVTPGWIGAVDIWTGSSLFIGMIFPVFYEAIYAFRRREAGVQPLDDAPTDTRDPLPSYGRYINVGDLSPRIPIIYLQDMGKSSKALFKEQAAYAYNRVVAASPLVMLCQLNGELIALTTRLNAQDSTSDVVTNAMKPYLKVGREALEGGVQGRTALRQAVRLIDMAKPISGPKIVGKATSEGLNLLEVSQLLRDPVRVKSVQTALAKVLGRRAHSKPSD